NQSENHSSDRAGGSSEAGYLPYFMTAKKIDGQTQDVAGPTGVSKQNHTYPQQCDRCTGSSRGANTAQHEQSAASHYDFSSSYGGQTSAHKHIGRISAQPSSNAGEDKWNPC